MDQSQEVDKANDPQLQMQTLEMANKKMTEEFNAQRAKMKDLFLQKEAELSRKHEENNLLMDQLKKLKNELDDVKSQLVVDSMRESDFEDEKRKAEEEIASLQRLIHETVEESSSNRSLYDHDLQKLQAYIQYLQKENEQLKHQNNQYQQQSTSQEHSLAPSVMINALTKGIAKKLDAFGGSQDEKSEKTLEDIEVLRSLVDPLEEQIRALKEKLRATDEQLQKCRECRHLVNESIKPTPNQTPEKTNLQISASTNTSFEMPKSDILPCDMCSNYEAQLVKEQQHVNELKSQVLVAEKAADRHKEDLLKEIGFRKEMEEKWNEKREEHKQQVAELTRTTDCTQQDLIELRQYFNQVSKEMSAELMKLTKDREQIYHDLDKLQTENENLVGKYTIHSQQLQSEFIDLPDTVEELHELVLKNQQELIITKVGKEAAEDNVKSLQSKIDLLNSQIAHYKHEKKAVAESADIEIKYLREQIEILEKEKKQYLAKNVNIKEREEQIKQLSDNIVKLQNQNHELKTRLHSQQEDLENAEAVQRDLVKLSQNLQIQFEKIREADHQVRWQHEEDIEECSNCHIPFSNSKRKQHCRHCGQIFCPNCVARVVQSGPNMRPSHVCDVCYTLLVKTSAPYFSKELPTT
uniref:FYVE-type domain-containing protein n=1 Tax=Dendroctonus ponderosae TaxID=77166 RepID=A0AAR5PCN2_DENPD